ncbi:MAG: NUDIX domain-containing protein [Streptosporangiales bacterium]|nr:NUDIX domain-containing protein [Streptosporangiales bacterium]
MAAIGRTYATDGYDRQRYERLQVLAAEMLADLAGTSPGRVADLYLPDKGYVTPKVDVRAAVRDEAGRLLLVQERSDGCWALPGGWADIGDAPADVAVRETAEEAGYPVEPVRLLGVYDRDAPQWNHPPHAYHVYKVVVACQLLGAADGGPADGAGGEIADVGFFPPDQLPPLSKTRNSAELLARIVARLDDPAAPADFD